MIKAYEAWSMAKSFCRTKDLLEKIEKQIINESQRGCYNLTLYWHKYLCEIDLIYVRSILEKSGYIVRYKTVTEWNGSIVIIIEISWESGELNEIKS